MKALLIKFNLSTGERAGGIDPRDKQLFCNGWQKLNHEDPEESYEIRLIKDARDMTQYENIEGVVILNGKESINKKIEEIVEVKYSISDKDLLLRILEKKDLLEEYPDLSDNSLMLLKQEHGVKVIRENKPNLIK